MLDTLDEARQLEAQGLSEAAISRYRELMEDGSADCTTYIRCATLHRERGRPAEARVVFEAAIARFPEDPWPRHRLGELLGQNGRPIAALQRMGEARDLAPHGEEFHVNIAATASNLQWLDVAYAAARRLRPEVGDWWAGARRRGLESYREERTATLALLRARPVPVTNAFLWELGQRLVRLGRLRLSGRIAAKLIADDPMSWPAYYMMADVILRQAGANAAVDYLRGNPAMQADPIAYGLRLARLLHEAGRFTELLEALEAPGLPQEDEQIRWLRFMALFLLGWTDQLRDYCSRWLAASPSAMTPAATLAALRHQTQDLKPWKGGQAALLKPHIAQFWDKADVPLDVRGAMLSWTQLNPQAAYTLFDDSSARRFLEAHYGSAIVQTYDACHHPAMKADYFRVAFLHQAGGLWADADELCLRPLDYIIDAAEDAEIIAMLDGDIPGYVHNAFLGCRPRSRVIRQALEEATALVARELQAGRRPDIWTITGPGLITRAIGRYLVDNPSAWEREDMLLLGRQQYAYFAQKDGQLAYKHDAAKNWNMI